MVYASMKNDNIVQEWFEYADKDLTSAEFLLKMEPVPSEVICFHCQQCGEKYLKGYLAYKEEEIIKTHDLYLLYERCIKYDEALWK